MKASNTRHTTQFLLPFMVVAALVTASAQLISGEHPLPPVRQAEQPAFLENAGQFTFSDSKSDPVLFVASEGNMTVFLRKTGISYVFRRVERKTPFSHRGDCAVHDRCEERLSFVAPAEQLRIDIQFEGATSNPSIVRSLPLAAPARYYRGANAPIIASSFQEVMYRDIYPGIDLRFYLKDGGLKYDFIVYPGADPSRIQLRCDGAEDISLLPGGALLIETLFGSVKEHTPVCYSQGASWMHGYPAGGIPVQGKFTLRGTAIGFDLENRSINETLVIDPFVEWSTYLGGSLDDGGNSGGFAPNGDIIAAGYTSSIDFPATPGVPQPVHAGVIDGFIARYSPNGTRLWTTFLGGDIEDAVMALDVAPSGEIVIGGYTTSSVFPTTPGAFQTALAGGMDAFVAKLNGDGTIIWCTRFGGSQDENVEGLALDRQGNIVFTGRTQSPNFPRTANAFQLVRGGFPGDMDAYMAKLSPAGARLYGTYYGGDSEDWGHSISADAAGNIYMVGHTESKNFPASGSFQNTMRGQRDGYLVKFAPDGTRLWATMIGGNGFDDAYCVVASPLNGAVVGGTIWSTDFQVSPGAFQKALAGQGDCFLMTAAGDGALNWSTFVGGEGNDSFYAVDVFPSGNIVVAGASDSKAMYTTPDAFQSANAGKMDGYIMKTNPFGSPMYATYLGGNGWEYDNSLRGQMALSTNNRGQAVFVSRTKEGAFPVLNPDQPDSAGAWDATVTKFNCTVTPPPVISAQGPLEFCDGDSVTLSAANGYLTYVWSTGDTAQSITVRQSGEYFVTVSDTNDCAADSPPLRVVVNQPPQPAIAVSGPLTFCDGDSVVLDGGAGYAVYQWSTGAATRTITVKQSGVYSVSVVDTNGCSGNAPDVTVTVNPLPVPVINPSGQTSFCQGDSIILDVGAGYLSYVWSTGATTQTITVRTSGTYTVRVENQFNCTALSPPVDVTVFPLPQPVITPSGPTVFCSGDSVVLDVGDGYIGYLWSNNEAGPQITVRSSGTYSVRITDSNGCENTSPPVSVTVHPLPTPVITALNGTSFCEGEGSLDAGAGYITYNWSNGETTRTIVPQASGIYTVTVLDANGCSATSPPVNITVFPNPKPQLDLSGPLSFCDGDSVTLDAGAGFSSYQWSNGSSAQSIVVKTAGIYFVRTVSMDGCANISDTATVVVWALPAKPAITQVRDTLFSTNSPGYQWKIDGQEINGETGRYLLVPRSGRFTVLAISPEGCAVESDPLQVTIATVTVSLPTLEAEPGSRLTVPLRIQSSDLLVESGARTFSARIRFDKSILFNTAPATGWQEDAADRILDLAGAWTPGEAQLSSFDVLAMLGSAQSTPLTIERFEWNEGIVRVTRNNGNFKLIVCEEGGARLFDSSIPLQLAQNSPNPFNSSTVIRYSLIERGNTRLAVTDLLGREVAVLRSGPAEPGEYETRFESGSLPSGRYFYVLSTPTGSLVRMMQLVK